MDTRALAACAWYVVVLTVLAGAQAPDDNPLASLFADIARNRGITPAADKTIQPLLESIETMPAAQVRDAMPAVVAALSSGYERVQLLAAMVCFSVVRRPDGTELLARDLLAVASLFRSQDADAASLAGLTFANVRTPVGPEVVASILAVVDQQRVSGRDRLPALATVVRMAPADRAVIDSVIRFMREPLDAATRADVLTAIRVSRMDAPSVRLQIIDWLRDTDPRVRELAIAALTRIGADALAEAAPELRRMAEDAAEQAAVRGAAAKALLSLR